MLTFSWWLATGNWVDLFLQFDSTYVFLICCKMFCLLTSLMKMRCTLNHNVIKSGIEEDRIMGLGFWNHIRFWHDLCIIEIKAIGYAGSYCLLSQLSWLLLPLKFSHLDYSCTSSFITWQVVTMNLWCLTLLAWVQYNTPLNNIVHSFQSDRWSLLLYQFVDQIHKLWWIYDCMMIGNLSSQNPVCFIFYLKSQFMVVGFVLCLTDR